MKSLRLLLLCFVLPAITYAQSNFKPALIIKFTGDTVKGYIDYREWDNTPKFVNFKASLEDKKVVRFYPAMLRSFMVNSVDKYITYTGLISMDKNKFPDLPAYLDTTNIQDTVFLQVRYQGPQVSLLVHQDDIKTRRFVKEQQEQPVELKYYQYYTNGSNTVCSIATSYVDKLKELAQKYNPSNKKLIALIDHSQFSESDLYKILKLINNDQSKGPSGTFGNRLFAGILLNRTATSFDGIN